VIAAAEEAQAADQAAEAEGGDVTDAVLEQAEADEPGVAEENVEAAVEEAAEEPVAEEAPAEDTTEASPSDEETE
jgi:hypothetical protein